MKLKFYMRGLGIGILLTTLILMIANPKEKLSDDQIIERAKALGMEMVENGDKSLIEVPESMEPTAGPTTEPTPEPTVEPTVEPNIELTIEPVVPSATPSLKPTTSSVEDETPIVETPVDNTKPVTGTEITFTVERGMSSGQVAALLVEKGLVEDAKKFNQYIVKAGKASVIRVGTYKVTIGASYEEIISMLTTK